VVVGGVVLTFKGMKRMKRGVAMERGRNAMAFFEMRLRCDRCQW
jgi:hypothetical protein